MTTIDLSGWQMLAIYLLLLVPLALMLVFRLPLMRPTLLALVRMTVQLWLVGLYLQVIFYWNAWWLNLVWITAMLLVANSAILGQAGLVRGRFFLATLAGTAVAIVGVAGFFVVVVLRPTPLYDARYLIPIVGMVLGNCLRGNVLSLERFYSGIRENEPAFMTYHMLGASLREAVQPYLRRSLQAAIGPMIATMATMGLVSLPGMMTGQILGGAFPVTAIKYQIAIMICIFSAMMMASVLNLLLSIPRAFDAFGMLRPEIFRD